MCERKVWYEGLLRKRGGLLPKEVVLGCYPESAKEVFKPIKEQKMATLEELEAQAKELTETIAKLKAEAAIPANWPKKIEQGMIFKSKHCGNVWMAVAGKEYAMSGDVRLRFVLLQSSTSMGVGRMTLPEFRPNHKEHAYVGRAGDLLKIKNTEYTTLSGEPGRIVIEELGERDFSIEVERPFHGVGKAFAYANAINNALVKVRY
jgi:hypothetical protein